jgi:hypothetical protein
MPLLTVKLHRREIDRFIIISFVKSAVVCRNAKMLVITGKLLYFVRHCLVFFKIRTRILSAYVEMAS